MINHNDSSKSLNGYSPAETKKNSTRCVCNKNKIFSKELPVGKPIGNATACALGNSVPPLLIGATGELRAGGTGLARRYLNKPELTVDFF